MDLQIIKSHFGEKIKIFQNFSEVNAKLSVTEKQIFYKIGLPDYGGYGAIM